jgi:hypothetical protein
MSPIARAKYICRGMRERQFNIYAAEEIGKRRREVKKNPPPLGGASSIPDYGLALRRFAITFTVHATLGRNPLDE